MKQGGTKESLCGGPGDSALCGNGLQDEGEECDDGNTADGDVCTPDCMLPSNCGNGVVDADEACDDGNKSDQDACTTVCKFPICGDGSVGPGEQCDDGNDVGTDICTPMCRLPACNDGFVNTADEVCDDGNGVEIDGCTSRCTASPEVPGLELRLVQTKQFQFSWTGLGAESYQLYERSGVGEEFVLVGDDIVGESFALTVPLHLRSNASYKLRACNAVRCVESEVVDVAGTLVDAIGYLKAPDVGLGDNFGSSVGLSRDGATLVVGAIGDDGGAGTVHVFAWTGDHWSEQALLKPSNPIVASFFGYSVALSEDGNTLAVGAEGDNSTATGIDGPYDCCADNAGAAYVFARVGENWSEQAYIKSSTTKAEESYGYSVALSGDGDTLAVGALFGDSQDEDAFPSVGAVDVFVRAGEAWAQEARLQAANKDSEDYFGRSVALSRDGNTLAVGADQEDGDATTVNGEDNDAAEAAGATYVFVRTGNAWSEQAYIKASSTDTGDMFGASVALSRDGNILAAGAFGSEAVHLFARLDDVWSERTHVEASNPDSGDGFGGSVALSGDGDILVVGAFGEDSQATGINDAPNNSANGAGAAYVFVRIGDDWTERAFVKANRVNSGDSFGSSLALSEDGKSLAIGAIGENYGLDPSILTFDAGAVYLY